MVFRELPCRVLEIRRQKYVKVAAARGKNNDGDEMINVPHGKLDSKDSYHYR